MPMQTLTELRMEVSGIDGWMGGWTEFVAEL